MTKQDRQLARKARRNGARYCKRIIQECRKRQMSVSLGFALIQHESSFQNIFGHDPSIFRGAGKVTRWKYARYKKLRGPQGRGGMQGVGPAQLTYWSTQDKADSLGGCWKPGINISVGIAQLAANIKAHGGDERAGLEAYNGSGPAAAKYAEDVLAIKAHWHSVLS